jgi:hypothetical protein
LIERLAHLIGGLVAILRIERERLEDDRLELRRHVGAMRPRRRNLAADDRAHRQKVVLAFEEAARRRELVGDNAEREHVAAAIGRRAARALLGRHVRGFAF